MTTPAIIVALSCSGICSGARPNAAAATQLPADVTMNEGAGRGGYLSVMLRLDSGVEFPCVIDTGSPGSLLPKSVEQTLGRHVGTITIRTLDGPRQKVRLYATPKLYLGKTPLMTTATIGTWDDASGLLGMDCLCHYCIQLDFVAGKIRFLNPERVDPAGLGKSYSVTSSGETRIRQPALFGQKATTLLVDTGFPFDGMVGTAVFKRAAENSQPIPLLKDGVPAGTVPGMRCFPMCVWDDTTYTNLVLEPGRPDLLGLRFLARHTVTFNFPKRVVYLKFISANPLPPTKRPL